MDFVLRRRVAGLAAFTNVGSKQLMRERLAAVLREFGPFVVAVAGQQSCTISCWWNDALTVGFGIGTPFVVRSPMSGKAWHVTQRSADAPRNGAWQAKQSVASAA